MGKAYPSLRTWVSPLTAPVSTGSTHDTSGVIHIEAPSGTSFTLKNFLDIWKSRFQQLVYPGQLDQASGWQVYVDGKPYGGDFQAIPLQAHALISLMFDSPGIAPDTSYPWNGL